VPAGQTIARRLREALWLACISCWALGAGLLVSGLAPFILAGGAGRSAPHWATLVTCGAMLLTGGAYIGLGQLIRRRVAWALRIALCLSVLLLAGVLGMLLLNGQRIPLFPTLLGLCTTVTCWLAIAAQDAVGSTPDPQ
jgi:hypothetical protein